MLSKKTKKTNHLATCAIIALLPVISHALQGVYIVELFTCEVAIANYKHLTKTTKEDNPKFVQEQLEVSLESLTQELKEHQECKGGTDGK